MKRQFKYFVFVACLSVCIFITHALADELNMTYDDKNGRFVFRWTRAGVGAIEYILEPANKIEPKILANIVPSSKNGIYTFNYEVSNKEGARQVLGGIYIEHFSPVVNTKKPYPSNEWSMGEYGEYKMWHWSKHSGEFLGITAGETVKGFSFSSEGLPTIVVAAFEGRSQNSGFEPSDDLDSKKVNAEYEELLDEIHEKYPHEFKSKTLKTLGPGEIPKDFNALTFIDSIITMKHEAAKLGWITNDGIIKSLDAKLDNAKKAIAGNNMTSAKNLLEAFIKEVEAQGCPTIDDCPKGKHLSSEAYALLKYNALYLLDRL